MTISDRMWERVAYLTRFDGSSTADMLASLVSAHYAQENLGPSMGSNVPDNTPHVITTQFLDTGMGAIIRTHI